MDKDIFVQIREGTDKSRETYLAARFVVALSGFAHFGADLFGVNFTKIFFFNFSFSNYLIFLIYKDYFFRLFSKSVEIFPVSDKINL